MRRIVKPRSVFENFHGLPPMPENRAGNLRLDMNESTVGCSPKVRAALGRLGDEEVGMYPEKRNVTARMARLFGMSARELVLTAGIDEALRLVADVFIERGRRVLVVEPTFPMYRFHAEQREARVESLICGENLKFPLNEVLRALKRAPAVFFLANPNNPTGALLDKTTLAKILDAATQTLVLVDEAYCEFSGVTVLQWIRHRENLAVTRTFSKAAGLAGLRIGCLFAHRETAKFMKRAQEPFPLGIAPMVAAEAALLDKAFTRRAVAGILEGRKILENGLHALSVPVFPSAANFVLADFGARGPQIIAALARRGILIRDQTISMGRPGFARITAGTTAQMRRLLNELKKLM